ncbi:MAG: hypothetical protein IJF48_01065 [Clostridia bacterium]|nr:hypothetical protein [Clostridia bacterium]
MERIMLLLTITKRGEGAKIIDTLNSHCITWHLRSVGQGTASSETMDILGLGSRDKDIIISLAAKRAAEQFAAELESDPTRRGGHGIMMIVPLTAINNLTATMVTRAAESINVQEDNAMKNEYKHSLVLVAANRGCSDEVMRVARGAGATGGTVIRANLADNEAAELLGITLEEEREVIAILVPDTIRDRVMEDINRELGLRTDTQAILCSLGVDKAMRI